MSAQYGACDGTNSGMKLVEPSMAYDLPIQAFRREYLESGDSMDGGASLREFERTQDWLDHLEPQTSQFIYIREADDTVAGVIQIRHRFNAFLEKYAGHIGYCVRPSERCKGYATQMLRGCFPNANALGLMMCWSVVWMTTKGVEGPSWPTAAYMNRRSLSRRVRAGSNGTGFICPEVYQYNTYFAN